MMEEQAKGLPREIVTDRAVLLVIAGGLIAILMAIIVGLFLTPRALPNWAENVFVSIATASALKLGDALSTLVALSTGRQVAQLGTQLAQTAPIGGEIDAHITNRPGDPPIPVEPSNEGQWPVEPKPTTREGELP